MIVSDFVAVAAVAYSVDSAASPLENEPMGFASHHDAACAAVASPVDPSFLRAAVPLNPDAFAVPVFALGVACAAVAVLLVQIGAENVTEGAPNNLARLRAFH